MQDKGFKDHPDFPASGVVLPLIPLTGSLIDMLVLNGAHSSRAHTLTMNAWHASSMVICLRFALCLRYNA